MWVKFSTALADGTCNGLSVCADKIQMWKSSSPRWWHCLWMVRKQWGQRCRNRIHAHLRQRDSSMSPAQKGVYSEAAVRRGALSRTWPRQHPDKLSASRTVQNGFLMLNSTQPVWLLQHPRLTQGCCLSSAIYAKHLSSLNIPILTWLREKTMEKVTGDH